MLETHNKENLYLKLILDVIKCPSQNSKKILYSYKYWQCEKPMDNPAQTLPPIPMICCQ